MAPNDLCELASFTIDTESVVFSLKMDQFSGGSAFLHVSLYLSLAIFMRFEAKIGD